MLIGFIVVIVMILVIVGLMATGNSGGGTGVNQTRATKVVTEIGTLAQSLSFFKTTTGSGNFEGFTHTAGAALLDGYKNGVNGVETGTLSEVTLTADLNINTDSTDVDLLPIQSQAATSVSYYFATNTAADSLIISVVLNGDDAVLNQAIGSTVVSKLNGGNMSIDQTGVTTAGTFVKNDVIRVTTK